MDKNAHQYLLPATILLSAIVASVVTRKLTIPAALTGGLVGCCVFAGAGFDGIIMVATFFLLGTLATSWKKKLKVANGLSAAESDRRNAGQVLANAGVAAFCGILVCLWPAYSQVFRIMMAGSLSAATSDTLSSELGNVYGRRFYNILSLKKDIRGLDGVISMEGTLCGIAGSLIIGLIFVCGLGYGWLALFIIIIAGTIGNLVDSLLGAGPERKQILNNDWVNFFNTFTGAFVAAGLAACIG